MTLFEAATLREWQDLERKAAYSPKGKKREREEMLRRHATKLLRDELGFRNPSGAVLGNILTAPS